MAKDIEMGESLNAGPSNHNDNDNEDSLIPGHMLNKINPVPVVKSRADVVRKRRRQFAELLISPEHIQERRKKTNLKSKSIATAGQQKNKLQPKKNTKHIRSVVESEDEDDDVFCIVCTHPYKTSKSDWLQCRRCKNWAHAKCAKNNPLYICNNCESSDDTD